MEFFKFVDQTNCLIHMQISTQVVEIQNLHKISRKAMVTEKE